MAHLTLGVFGAFQVTLANGSTAKFESDKTRGLLAYLAVESDRPHRRDALIGLLWPDESERTARHNLRQALFSLRKTIGDSTARPPFLNITRDEIQFNPASKFMLDAASFSAHLAATKSHAHSRLDACAVCAPRLQQAVDLYRGKFLQEFFLEDSAEFEEWALAQRESLHQRALDALTALGNYYEQRGDVGATQSCGLRELELDPWREPAHRKMMRMLALEGQYGAALAQYETCRRVLAEELGVEPSAETRELYERIKSGGAVEIRPKISSFTPPSSSLPAYLTPFIGRERELQDLGRLIADPTCRWITLVGPGGMGKTRLAVQAAAAQRSSFAQGVAFVSLVNVDSVEAIVPAMADAMGFCFYGSTSPRAQLFNHLRDKQLLLVLDNVEQLVDAAELFVEILQQTPAIKLLVTSREILNVQGEWVYPVEGLQIPEDDGINAIEASAAVALFTQRAQRTRVGFALSAAERPSVSRLCRLVGGTPLALELAATWVRTLAMAEIVKEIEHNLDFLSTTVRDLPERHQSLRAVFDHSWEMLAAEEQRVLRELSAFHGRFRRQAAEQIAGASLATLSALVAKSLVRRTDSGHYDLHELVRQYAASKLAAEGSAQEVAERHSRYYLDWLGRCAARLHDHRQKETVTELADEVDNLRAAWDRATAQQDFARLRLASPALWYLFELRTWLAEGETIFRNAAESAQARAVETQPSDDLLIALNDLRAHEAYFSFRLGKAAAAYAMLLPCVQYLQLSADRSALVSALWFLGIACWELGKYAEANQALQASQEKARACGERWWETLAGELLGIVAYATGEYDQSRGYLTGALEGMREMGDPMFTAHVLVFLSQTIVAMGQSAEAEKYLRESLALAQENGHRHVMGRALDGLGRLAQATNPSEARTLFAASAAVFREIGDLGILSVVLNHQGYNSLALGDLAEAQESFGEVLRLAREGGYMPFALDALAGQAMLWAKDSYTERALELAIQVLQHPAATHDAKSRAETLRSELVARLTPEQIERAGTKSFAQVVANVLASAHSATTKPV